MVATFRRLALNTHIKNIKVTIEEHHEVRMSTLLIPINVSLLQDITRILDALSNFDADELDINQRYVRELILIANCENNCNNYHGEISILSLIIFLRLK